jgi:indole-3-glycerol phosphate synthase
MSILEKILSNTRKEVEVKKVRAPLQALKEKELFSLRRLSLAESLTNHQPGIIAEIKKASPSKGVIRQDFDPLAIALSYVQNGAAALSVLTVEKFFQGRLEFIEQMRPDVSVPILRKDFIVDAYQLYEAKAHGADAVLLIAAALDSSQLHDFVEEAKEIDLECLVEVHSAKEVESLDFGVVRLVGINNRNLETFETDLQTSVTLKKHIPNNVQVVSESAINTQDDIRLLMRAGIQAFLIGEAFMRAENPGEVLHQLLCSVHSIRS